MLLDSTFLVDLLRKIDLKAIQKATELDVQLAVKAVSSVSVLELWRGALRSVRQEQEKQKIQELLQSVVVYPFDEAVAKKAAEIEAFLAAQGELIDLEDIMIAATALISNETLLTRNDKHFKRVIGLNVETY